MDVPHVSDFPTSHVSVHILYVLTTSTLFPIYIFFLFYFHFLEEKRCLIPIFST